jgi:hypothetical protein
MLLVVQRGHVSCISSAGENSSQNYGEKLLKKKNKKTLAQKYNGDERKSVESVSLLYRNGTALRTNPSVSSTETARPYVEESGILDPEPVPATTRADFFFVKTHGRSSHELPRSGRTGPQNPVKNLPDRRKHGGKRERGART